MMSRRSNPAAPLAACPQPMGLKSGNGPVISKRMRRNPILSARELDESHDISRRSWVASANSPETDFPIQNLPFGVFRAAGETGAPRGGVAIGDRILDVAPAAAELGEARHLVELLAAPTLGPLMALAPAAWTELRLAISRLLAI